MPSEASKLSSIDVAAVGVAPDPIPEITAALDGYVLGHWRGILIGIWAVPSTLERATEQDVLLKAMSAQWHKVSSVHLIIERAPLPGPEVRAAYEDIMRRYAQRIVCTALLLDGGGFWASAVRAFLTGIQLFGRRVSIKVFGRIEPLVDWVAQAHSAEAGVQIDADELRRALEWMLNRPTVLGHHAITAR